jgi:hypothetical protein
VGLSYIDKVAVAIRERVPHERLPEQQGLDDLFRLYSLLALAKGTRTTAEDVHDAWSVWILQRGEDHESVRPFEELDTATQDQDRAFVEAIHAVCRDDLV